jgi:hypothetical protein
MSQNNFPGALLNSSNFNGLPTSSSAANYTVVDGDTLQINTSRTPSSSSATGYPGEICWDGSYLYVCTASNTWQRIALSTF